MAVTHRHLQLLRQLRRGGKRACDILKQKETQKLLREVAINILRGVVPLTTLHRNKLKKHAQSVRALSRKSTSLKKRLNIEQEGGFLGALLAPAISFLASKLL